MNWDLALAVCYLLSYVYGMHGMVYQQADHIGGSFKWEHFADDQLIDSNICS